MATEPQSNKGQPGFGPSERLMAMFRACSRDPTEEIKTRLRRMLHTFLQHHRDNTENGNTNELAKKCCFQELFQDCYYRILENIAIQERERKGTSDISGLFGNELFQSCLVACCLMFTISSNRLLCNFPLVLKIFKLAPYHFLKVIEPVLRAIGDRSLPVFTHLTQVEKKILESLAWTKNSPLWEDIRANEGHLPTCQQVIDPAELEDPKQTLFQPDRNQPVDLSLGAKPSTSTEQQRSSSTVDRSRKSSYLHSFAVKIYNLMGKRLRERCSNSNELRLKIWTCFEYSLVHCTDLMMDRHLDQLLMCAIFHTHKIITLDTLSKGIMNCYKSQPRASESVCKDVLISRGDVENHLTGQNNNGDHSISILTPNTPSTHYPGPSQEQRSNFLNFYNCFCEPKMQHNNGDHSIGILTPNTPSTHYPGPSQEERWDFFDFYIRVYEPKMQHFALQFGGDTPPLSPYPRQRKVSPRRQRLSSSHSIFISPYNKKTISPPTTGLCYVFSSSPRERLREMNNMVKVGSSSNKRRFKLSLDGDEEEPGEGEKDKDGPPARRLRLDGQSALQRRLGDVMNDRERSRDQDQTSPVIRPNLH